MTFNRSRDPLQPLSIWGERSCQHILRLVGPLFSCALDFETFPSFSLLPPPIQLIQVPLSGSTNRHHCSTTTCSVQLLWSCSPANNILYLLLKMQATLVLKAPIFSQLRSLFQLISSFNNPLFVHWITNRGCEDCI